MFNPKDHKLGSSLVVLDKASMIDSLLLYRVISALPDNCRLILVGDDEQLPPVTPGQPFVDLINHGPGIIQPALTTNHRQAQGLIATACLSVRDGKMPVWCRRCSYAWRSA